MIEITLYSGCKLNDNYKNVFAQAVRPPSYQTSFFDTYLSNLNKITFTLDLVYQDDMSSFNFYLKDSGYNDIYTYNYMRIETLSPSDNQTRIVRYAFINSIQIKNDIGIINYKIDVWHSFVNHSLLGINKSYLKGLRVINGTGGLIVPNYYTLPVDYGGNERLNINKMTNLSRYLIILQIQEYNTAQFGNATKSDTRYFCIDRYSYGQGTTPLYAFRELDSLAVVEEFIQILINITGEQSFLYADDNTTIASLPSDTPKESRYWKIGNIYVVPYYTIIANKFNWTYKNYTKFSNASTNEYWYVPLMEVLTNIEPFVLNEFIISNNFKIKGIGLYGLFLPVVMNGTTMSGSVSMSISRTEFNLFMNYQNKIIDITSHFEVIAPSTQINGEIIAQQKISRVLQNNNDITSLINSAGNIFSLSNNMNLADLYGRKSDIEYAKWNYGKNNMTDRSNEFYYNVLEDKYMKSGVMSGLTFGTNLYNIALSRSARNMPIYNTTNIVKVNNIALLNAKTWICSFSITSDNDNFVKETINQVGYNVFEYISNINELGINNNGEDFNNNGILYNTIQLGHSDVYGNFPLDIKKQLDAILENGIKIWYNNDIDDTNDTYVVG